MPTIEISFTPLPAHVRTARLIAAAMARRSGIEGALLDEIRLAVGEACSRAVGVHQRQAATQPVTLTITDEQDTFVAIVADTAGADVANANDGADPFQLVEADSELAGGGVDDVLDVLPSGFGLAVIAGLVDDLDVVRAPTGTVVRMTWKTARPEGEREASR
jgi:anti-sigma regulatory factor (Ser/Thr protein kinase)